MRIVIGEDSALFREGLARLLEDAGHVIVGKAADANLLPSIVDQSCPDLVITDIRMPPEHADDGARVARRIRQAHPALGIVLLSQHVESTHSLALAAQGRFGYLLKDRARRRGRHRPRSRGGQSLVDRQGAFRVSGGSYAS